MLQQDESDDYVLATGTSRTVGELVDTAFAVVGLDARERVRVDQSLVRPPDPVPLVGDPSKAEGCLDWRRRTSFAEMIELMVEHDLALLSAAGPERAGPVA